MPQLRLNVPQYVIDQINSSLRTINGQASDNGKPSRPYSLDEIGKEALAVYKWSVERMAQGRAIGAADPVTARLVEQIATPYTPIKTDDVPPASAVDQSPNASDG